MSPRLTPIERCRDVAGLHPHEIMLGVSPTGKHERLLETYRRGRSRAAARTRIVADIRLAVSGGASRRAADLLVVLRRLLALDPGGVVQSGAEVCPVRRARAAARRRQGRLVSIAPPASAPSADEWGRVIRWKRPS